MEDQDRAGKKKNPSWPALRGEPVKGHVCKGRPLGPRPGRKPNPLADWPPRYHGSALERKNKSANCWEEGGGEGRLCLGWQDKETFFWPEPFSPARSPGKISACGQAAGKKGV